MRSFPVLTSASGCHGSQSFLSLKFFLHTFICYSLLLLDTCRHPAPPPFVCFTELLPYRHHASGPRIALKRMSDVRKYCNPSPSFKPNIVFQNMKSHSASRGYLFQLMSGLQGIRFKLEEGDHGFIASPDGFERTLVLRICSVFKSDSLKKAPFSLPSNTGRMKVRS